MNEVQFPLRVIQVKEMGYLVDAGDSIVATSGVVDTQWLSWLARVANQSAEIGFEEIYSLLRNAHSDKEMFQSVQYILLKLSKANESLRFLRKCDRCKTYSVDEYNVCYLCGEGTPETKFYADKG